MKNGTTRRLCAGWVFACGIWLFSSGQAVADAGSRPVLDTATGADLRFGVTSQRYLGPEMTFVAFGDRVGYAAHIDVPLARGARIVLSGEVYPAAGRLGDPVSCAAESYSGEGEPTADQVVGAAACFSAATAHTIGLGVGWHFRIAPGIRVSHSLTVDGAWLNGLVVPLDASQVGSFGLANVLAIGPGCRVRFAWAPPRFPAHIGLALHTGLLVAGVGPVIQVYTPIGIGLDLGVSSRPTHRTGRPVEVQVPGF